MSFRSYISHAIASSLLSDNMALRNQTLKDEIVSKLAEKAQGV